MSINDDILYKIDSEIGKDKKVVELQREIERLNQEIIGLNNCIIEFHSEFCNKQAEINKLNNIINELEKWLKEEYEATVFDYHFAIEDVLNKLQELKGSNEPSFEEMVGFVENVCKDIKSQPTLHEELEEERKRIAKIVGDFKEVNK